MSVPDYKINYKSDFVLTINGDAGWTTQFCIKFWTGMPSQAYFVGFDGVKYVNCRVGDTPTQLLVMFDDHHLPIGKLMMQIAYHTTIEEFPGSVFDEVTNASDVIVTINGTDYQVMLDFTGEDTPELEFNLPAYANEAERIQNELQRQQNEAARIEAELQREQDTAAAVQGAENVNAQLNGTTLTVTNRQGVSTSVNTKGEQGAQGPVGPEGPQGEQGPKGEKGDTGATGPQGIQGPAGPQGQTGVSITDFVKTGETETDTLYDIEFSDDTTKPVAIPKGEKGDQGEQGPEGPQGPMGDVAVITPEQQAAFTMYSETGQNTNGPMTQKAVTDALGNIAASGVSYNNSESGLTAENVQVAIDELVVETSLEDSTDRSLGTARNWYINNSGKYAVGTRSAYYRCYTSVVTPGQKFAIQANSTMVAYYAFLASSPSSPTNGDPANFINVEGYQKKFMIPVDGKGMFTVPDVPEGTTVYLYIQRDNSNGIVFTPEYIHSVSGIKEVVSENNTDIVSLKNKIDGQTVMLSGTTIKQTIAQDNLVWNEATTGKTRAVIAPLADYVGKVLVISPNNGNSNVALLASDAHVAGTKPNFSRKERFIKIASDGEPYKVLITEEDLYLYYQSVGSPGASIAPIFTIEDIAYYEDVFSTIENFGLTLHRTDYNLVNYNAETNPDGIRTLELCIVTSTGLWRTLTARGFFLNVSAHKGGYLFVSSNNANCYLAFLKDDSYSDATLPNYATGSQRTDVGVGMRMKYAIPYDANYVFFGYYNTSGTWQVPTGVIAIGNDMSNGESGGSSVTENTLDIGFKYLLKKAQQLLNLKWTAKSNIAGSYAPAGEHTGLLYSSVQEYDRAIGHDVSVKTFMTAVNNPYSLLYTENLHTGVSAYNFSYHAIGGDTTHAFFGTVCSRFACFVSGMEEWSTGYIAWLCKQGILTKIEEQSAQGVQIGDWVWIPGHVQVVTNVVKANGVVTNVSITEAWQPYVRLVSKTAANFDKYVHGTSSDNSKPGYIYRNNEIFKNVTYEPSPFVAIDDEVLSGEYQYNNDICTYAGDYACFRKKEENDTRQDYNVWLNYNLGDSPSKNWTSIKLYRESYDKSTNVMTLVLVATYNDVDFTQHKYLIPYSDLTVAGKYRACLFDGNEESKPTYFEIIETNVSYTKNGDYITVYFSTPKNYNLNDGTRVYNNGEPTKVVIGTLGGSHMAVRILSPEERINGVVTFNPSALSSQQTLNEYDATNAYIKVFFKGEYGRVTNAPLKIDYNS